MVQTTSIVVLFFSQTVKQREPVTNWKFQREKWEQ